MGFYLRTRARVRCAAFLWLGLFALAFGMPSAAGQTFLERLEGVVRDQLDAPAQPAPEAPEEELPLPAPDAAGRVQPPIALEPPPPGSTPGPPPSRGPLPAAIEPRPEVGVPPPAATLVQPSPTGQIYLGLEAEELSAGGIGVRVTAVSEGSPAWKAGYEVGDRIAAVNGFAVSRLDSMVEQLSNRSPGDTVRFLVSRAGRNVELVAVLMDAGLTGRITGEAVRIGDLTGRPWLGVMVSDLTPSFRTQFGLTVFTGAAVTSVVVGSPANRAGIMAGDAIVQINGLPIETGLDLRRWMSSARPGQNMELVVYRGATRRIINLTLELDPDSQPPRTTARRTPPPPVPRPLPDDSAELSLESPQRPVPAPPRPATAPPPVASSERLADLEAENAALREELDRTSFRLNEMQQRLDRILDAVNANSGN